MGTRNTIDAVIKVILSLLLFLCLLAMPYGFYQLVRFLATIAFGYLAYKASLEAKTNQVALFVALALLFQPFMKIALGRQIWNIVDVVVGLGLIISIFIKEPKPLQD